MWYPNFNQINKIHISIENLVIPVSIFLTMKKWCSSALNMDEEAQPITHYLNLKQISLSKNLALWSHEFLSHHTSLKWQNKASVNHTLRWSQRKGNSNPSHKHYHLLIVILFLAIDFYYIMSHAINIPYVKRGNGHFPSMSL